jgi:hypothetical protein
MAAHHEPAFVECGARRLAFFEWSERGDDRGRDVRTRRAGAPELLDDDGLREHIRFEPARRNECVPELRECLVFGVECGAHDGRRDASVDEAAHRLAQLLVFFGDPNGHGADSRELAATWDTRAS